MIRTNVTIDVAIDNTVSVYKAMQELKKRETVVGYPEDKNKPRKKGDPMNNATIGYILDKGSPAANIPPRPFLEPGVEKASEEIERHLGEAADRAMDGNIAAVDRGLNRAGLEAAASVKNYMVTGQFEPLKAKTLRSIVKGYKKRRRDYGTQPLHATGQLIAAVTYAVRDKEK